ncbi:hypothetical protein ACIRQF_11825 [Streptomyces sp. NPDC101191]|uniref:hypothetical protein n=1 Tax=Streptomyces sp. NPDC101191 TaxID=3366126 RepID=UPI0037FC07FF
MSPRVRAVLTDRAAKELAAAGRGEEAAEAYERAADLWRALGAVRWAARALRARAWVALDVWGPDTAEVILEEALRVCERAHTAARSDAERAWYACEIGDSRRHLARLTLESLPGPTAGAEDSPERYAAELGCLARALDHTERAVAALRQGGAPGRAGGLRAELLAVRLEWGLGRAEAAVERARRVRDDVADLPDPDGSLALVAAECEALLVAAAGVIPTWGL